MSTAKSTKAAGTVFSGKGTDNVLATDVYAVKDSKVKNSVFDSLNKKAYEAADAIKQNPSIVQDLLMTSRDVIGGNVSKMEAIERIGLGLNSPALSRFTKYGTGMLGNLANKMGLKPDLVKKMKVAIGGTVSYLTTNDIQNRSLMELSGDLLGDSEVAKFFDLEAEAAMLSGVFDTAVDMGAYDLLSMYKERGIYDDTSFSVAVMSTSTHAVHNGDIAGILEVLKHISVEEFMGENPDAIKDILAAYTFKDGITPDQYPAKLAELKALLVRLDVHWYQVTRNGVWIINYDVMSTVSEDARTLFVTDDVLRPIVLTAPFYPIAAPLALAQAMYPNSSLQASSVD